MREIKRLILLVFAFLFIGYLNGYSQLCPTGNLLTNPYICGTYGDANGVSNWDWEVDPNVDYNKHCLTWQARTQQGDALTVMGSPFSNSQTIALDLISQAKDYTRARGWELLQRNFGCQGEKPYPYFILYNKYTGLMRVFIYQPGPAPQYSSVLLMIEPIKEPYPATTSLGDAQVTAPDRYNTSTLTSGFGRKLMSVTENSGSGNWRVAEFNMGFDPEVNAAIYSGTGFKITVNGITSSTVKAKIRGRSISGTDPNIYNYSYATNTDPEVEGNSKKFKTTGEKFIKFSKTLNESRDGVFKAANNIVNSLANVAYGQGMKGRIKGLAYSVREIASSSSSFGKVLGQLGSAMGAAGQVLNLIGGVIGLFGGGADEPAAMPTYTAYDMELDGVITTTAVPYTFVVRMPGALQPDNSNATYYKCPLGIFNIKNTPQADLVTYERNIGLAFPIPPKIVNFVSYRMRNNLEVTYNSGAGVEFVSAQAAIVGEVMADAGDNALYDLLADHEFSRFNLMLPDLQAGLLEVTTYDTEKKLHSFQTPYVNLECLSGLAFNARAETNVFLRVRAILKKKNDPDNIPIYFIRDYKIDTQDGEFDEELRNRHKSFYALSTPTPYSNYAELPVWVEDQLINNHHYTADYTEEKVDNKITAEGNVLVTAGAEAVFKAGYEVELNPGFEADYGSNFEATLKISQVNRPCGTPVIQAYQYSGNCYNTAVSGLRTTTNPTNADHTSDDELIKVFPIPTNSKLVISGIRDNKNAIVTILDQSGRTVREIRPAIFESAGRIDLDVSGLSNGIYFIKIQTLTQTITRKIVVSK